MILFAQTDGGMVNHFEVLREDIIVGEPVKELGVRVLHRVVAVNAVNLGCLYQQVGVELRCPQCGGGVGSEKWISGAAGEDRNPSIFEVPERLSANKRLAQRVNLNGAEDPGGLAETLEGLLECAGVDDGGEHSHIVGGVPRYAAGFGEGLAANEIAGAHHNG